MGSVPPQQVPPTAATTIQNVQINVQNNFNIAKSMQQTNLSQFTTNSAGNSTTSTQSTQSNTTSTSSGPQSSSQQWAHQYGHPSNQPQQQSPYGPGKPSGPLPSNAQQMPTPNMMQQQQMYKMGQYGPGKPGTPQLTGTPVQVAPTSSATAPYGMGNYASNQAPVI